MNKNIKLYSSEEVVLNNASQFQKPKFDKPSFEKPVMKKIVNTKSPNQEFDINKDVTEGEKIPIITISTKNLKDFYDGLMKSINKYDGDISEAIINGVVTPLSLTIDNIGAKTSEIDDKLKGLQTLIDDMPGIGGAPTLFRSTGEENGLL